MTPAVMLARARSALDGLRVDDAPTDAPITRTPPAPTPAQARPKSEPVVARAPVPSEERPALMTPDSREAPELTGPMRKIINAIAWWETFGLAAPSQAQVAYIAGYAPGSGTWDTYRSRLRSAGMITLDCGRISLSDAGRGEAEGTVGQPTADDLRRAVRDKLPGPHRKFFDVAVAAYPEAVSQPDLAAGAGYAYGSGTFDTYRSRLRGLEIIEFPTPGYVRAADWLFP